MKIIVGNKLQKFEEKHVLITLNLFEKFQNEKQAIEVLLGVPCQITL